MRKDSDFWDIGSIGAPEVEISIARCCECGATCTVDEVVNGYQQDLETPCTHSWFSYQQNGQYILE